MAQRCDPSVPADGRPLPGATSRLAFLVCYGRPVATLLLVYALGSIAAQLAGLAVPWLQARIFDSITRHAGVRAAGLFGFWAALALGGAVLDSANGMLATALRQRMANAAREDAHRHVLALPQGMLAARGPSAVLADVGYAADGTRVLTEGLGWGVGLATRLIGAIGAQAGLSGPVVLGILPLAAAYSVLPAVLARWIRRAEGREQDRRIAAQQMRLDHLAAAPDIRAFGASAWALERIRGRWTALMAAVWRRQMAHQVSAATNAALQKVCYLVAWIIGVHELRAGSLTVGGLLAITLYVGILLNPLERILSVQYHLVGWMLDLDRAVALFRLPTDPGFAPAAPCPPLDGDLTLDGVHVTHPAQDAPALTVGALTLRAGESVALVGSNGAGKSTLLGLLAGLIRPGAGRVRAAGADLADVGDRWLRRHVVSLGPVPAILGAPLVDNLRLADPDASDHRRLDALEQVGLGGWVRGLPLGLQTPLGAGGVVPSSGQRQRLGLARVLLRDGVILLLDEPTSALDAGAMDAVWPALRGRPGRTLVVATHDSRLAAAADRVLHLEAGHIVEDGPP